jgi:hypothetical protein
MKVLRIDSTGTIREVNVSGDYGSVNFFRETFTVTSAQAALGQIELLETPIDNSVTLQVDSVSQIQDLDFTLQNVSGVYRIDFVGDLAPGGVSAIAAGDVVVVAYSVAPIVPTVEFRKHLVTLSAADVANQFFDLPFLVIDQSEKITCSGLTFASDSEYTVSNAGIFSRVTFLGDLATGGNSPFSEGDVIEVTCGVNL